MRNVIFIRSYLGDLDWLPHCVASIRKFVTGIDGVTIAVPQAEATQFRAQGFEVVGAPNYEPGWHAQQSNKMHADLFVRGGDANIIYIDDDCMFTEPFDAAELFAPSGKPYALFTPYAELGTKSPWQPSTEAALGFPVANEFLRRHGFVYSSAELRAFRAWFLANRKVGIGNYIQEQGEKKANFAEFNVIGGWLFRFHHDSREWVQAGSNSDVGGQPGGNLPRLPLAQFWSHSRAASHMDEIKRILA